MVILQGFKDILVGIGNYVSNEVILREEYYGRCYVVEKIFLWIQLGYSMGICVYIQDIIFNILKIFVLEFRKENKMIMYFRYNRFNVELRIYVVEE